MGIAGWVWLFVAFYRRMKAEALANRDDRSWLFVGLAAASTAFAVGMLTYDAFAFVQVTFIMYLLLGLGAASVANPNSRRKLELVRMRARAESKAST